MATNREIRALIRFAQNAEDVASGLHIFRDSLPRNATRITAIIGELFAISSILRELDAASGDPRYEPSLYRIRDDTRLVFPTLEATLEAVFDMFARSRERPHQMVWDDLGYRMENEEGIGLLERLQWYHDFLDDLFDTLDGRPSDRLGVLRRRFAALYRTQEETNLRYRRAPIAAPGRSGASTPRPLRPPRPRRPTMPRLETPISPTSLSDEWDFEQPRPPAPEPPIPLSPTFTSSSSNTLSSSQTSYSSGPYSTEPPRGHWASIVFNGTAPATPFPLDYQSSERSSCHATADPIALRRLGQDGFVRALELPFDRESVWVRLYWRPADNRARILIMTKDNAGRQLHYCTPLNNLRLVRQGTCLQLCRLRRNGSLQLWANLNFVLYERMVLFYSTFVAMKRQDTHDVEHDDLIDDFELREKEEFGGEVMDGNMSHALRLFRDRPTGVVRIEASALRGSKQDVPIWTAFVTRYLAQQDDAWVQLEDDFTVSLAALRHPPHVFVSAYHPPRNRNNEYELRFAYTEDATDFVQLWAGLCRNALS